MNSYRWTPKSNDWLDHLEEAQPWISECKSNHPNCSLTGPRQFPKRFIDVGPSDGSKDPRLIVPEENPYKPWTPAPGAKYEYLALSYCWGNESKNLCTSYDTIEEHKKKILWKNIPKTVQDAILVTRKLGFRYLWVDALCIIQDEDNADWDIESLKMASIYGEAFLTISAAMSKGVSDGFEKSVPSSKDPNRLLNTDNNPVYQRAWTLQERVLSRRVLIFAANGLYWECSGHKPWQPQHVRKFPLIDDHNMIRLDRPVITKRMDATRQFAGKWNLLVIDYSQRSMEQPRKDKLKAFSGLAQAYHELTWYHYLAGLWRETLIEGLLWRCEDWWGGTREGFALPLPDMAPSWSWASTNSCVKYENPGSRPITKVMEAKVNLEKGGATFGDVKNGSIKLCGPLIPATKLLVTEFELVIDSGKTSSFNNDTRGMLLVEDGAREYRGLLLNPKKGGCYERIGYFSYLQWPTRKSTIKLVDFGESTVTIV